MNAGLDQAFGQSGLSYNLKWSPKKMKKQPRPVLSISRRPSFITASRRSFLFTLILITSVLTLAVAGGLLPTGRSASRPDQTDSAGQQNITAAVMQQIQALEDEKGSRTPAQKKIDSQLLYATKMERAQPIASGVSSLHVDVGASEQGRVVVDISAAVDDKLLQFLARTAPSCWSRHPNTIAFA